MRLSPYISRTNLCILAAVGFLVPLPAFPAAPKIDFIELFERDRVLIHFDTEANRSYALQYTETLVNGIPGGTWTNLFVAPKSLFPNHYVVVDTRLRPQRFYRLRVLP